jgi:hypothetical protein
MPTYYPKHVVDAVQGLLNTPPSAQPIGTTWMKIMHIFRLNNILKPKQTMQCKFVLPHPKNRSGMMLNGFNSRANASKVIKAGIFLSISRSEI